MNSVGINGNNNGDMTILSIAKHQQIVRCWWLITSIQELNHVSACVVASVGKERIEEIFRVPHNIGHSMSNGIEIKPLDELYTLPLLTVIISIR